jgi:hypothetical protein
MKIIAPKKYEVKEVWARSKFDVEGDQGLVVKVRKVFIGYFDISLKMDDLVNSLKEKGLYFSLGSSECEPKIYMYDKYIESGVIFETFEDCENFLRSGVSHDSLFELANSSFV